MNIIEKMVRICFVDNCISKRIKKVCTVNLTQFLVVSNLLRDCKFTQKRGGGEAKAQGGGLEILGKYVGKVFSQHGLTARKNSAFRNYFLQQTFIDWAILENGGFTQIFG